MARRGDLDGLRMLRAIVADQELPPFLATQVRRELTEAERRFGEPEQMDAIDLDAEMERLLERPHPAPVLR